MKTALITGGSRGIGRATVELFQKNNYQVVFFYKQSDEDAEKLSADTGAIAVKCDVRSSAEVEKNVQNILKRFKHIDVLVNAAGIAQTKLLTDITDEDWDNMLAGNLSSVFYVCRAVIPSMVSRQKGCIINVASMWASMGASCEAHYSASKAAVVALSKSLAKELAPSGIRVNSVSPGAIATDMLSFYTDQEIADIADSTPLMRLGKPYEVAELIYFLANDTASFITGQDIIVDGAYSIR